MDDLTKLYCLIDDFCKVFEPELNRRLLSGRKRKRLRVTCISLAELMTLVVLFHQIRYRQFRSFYLNHVCQHLREVFPKLPSYQRCVEVFDRAVLRRHSLIETVFHELKNLCQIEHTCHRCPIHFAVNLLSGIIAYCLMPKKPTLPVQISQPSALIPDIEVI